MAHLEYDDMLHAQELLDEDHTLLTLRILVSVIGFVIQAFHDVVLEVLEQIHFGLDVFWISIHSMALANEHATLSSGCDEVEVANKVLAAEPKCKK